MVPFSWQRCWLRFVYRAVGFSWNTKPVCNLDDRALFVFAEKHNHGSPSWVPAIRGFFVFMGLGKSRDTRQRGAPMKALRLGFALVVSGCAATVADVGQLLDRGYRCERPAYSVASGVRREMPCEICWKETRDPERRVHVCLVPSAPITGAGYNWEITVLVGDQEAWSYASGPLRGVPPTRMGIDCATSRPLPEGRIKFEGLHIMYWQ